MVTALYYTDAALDGTILLYNVVANHSVQHLLFWAIFGLVCCPLNLRSPGKIPAIVPIMESGH